MTIKPHLMTGLRNLVVGAAESIENGDPWSDAMDGSEVAELICYVARCIEVDELNKENEKER